MTDPIQRLITELCEADPSLKGRETALRGLLQELLSARPDAALDPVFRARLKAQLQARGVMARPRLAQWRTMRLYYGLGTVALVAVIIVATRPAPYGPSREVQQVALKSYDAATAPAQAPSAPETADTASQEMNTKMAMTGPAPTANTTDMKLTSSAFADGQPIPVQFTCDGSSEMPPLSWTGIPDTAQSLALIVHDPDAPREGGFTHWVVYDIPARLSGQQGTDGANGTGRTGYVGPCPSTGTHHYVFTLYALDTVLGLDAGTDREGFLKAADGHIVATAELTGTYSRQK